MKLRQKYQTCTFTFQLVKKLHETSEARASNLAVGGGRTGSTPEINAKKTLIGGSVPSVITASNSLLTFAMMKEDYVNRCQLKLMLAGDADVTFAVLDSRGMITTWDSRSIDKPVHHANINLQNTRGDTIQIQVIIMHIFICLIHKCRFSQGRSIFKTRRLRSSFLCKLMLTHDVCSVTKKNLCTF